MTEPLRSTLSVSSTEDTSLVLPSDNKHCTGQQRVLQQVNSVKRSKKVKHDSLPSPTSPLSVTEYSEPKFQFSPTRLTGSLFRKSSTNTSRRQSRMNSYSLSARSTMRRQINSTSQWESQIKSQSISNGIKPGSSDPTVNGAVTLMTQKGNLSRAATVKNTSSSQTVTKVRSKSDSTGMNGVTEAMTSMTLQEAVQYLTNPEVNYQLCGASFIQHHTLTEDEAKHKVCQLRGIPALIQLLKSDHSQLQQTAAAALRNVIFKNFENKLQVESCGGIEVILNLLTNTNNTETQKQLTGLLWNLSSADTLKPEIIKSGLPLLTEHIVIPYTDGNKFIDPEIFYNTTGCIRNLSCAEEDERIFMRNCPGLIKSLMTYVQYQMDMGEIEDKSVENCVCILHNLSYQLDKEAPEHFSVLEEKPSKKENTSKSLFSPKSTKSQTELSLPAMEQNNPEGISFLYQKKSLQLYLTLLQSSQNEATLEACCGALQNLTASTKPVSSRISQTVADKLNGLPSITPMLNSTNPTLQRAAMSLMGNMSRVAELRGTMAKKVLPPVSSVLSSVTPNMVKSDETIATACRVMHTLMMAEPELSKKVLNKNLIDTLSSLSKNMAFQTARRPAGVLLYSLWGQKDLQNVLKKQQMDKYMFINPVTSASYKLETDKKMG